MLMEPLAAGCMEFSPLILRPLQSARAKAATVIQVPGCQGGGAGPAQAVQVTSTRSASTVQCECWQTRSVGRT